MAVKISAALNSGRSIHLIKCYSNKKSYKMTLLMHSNSNKAKVHKYNLLAIIALFISVETRDAEEHF